MHGGAGGPHDEPRSAELHDVLTEDVARLAVADVVVERVSAISDLARAVAPADGADERAARAAPAARAPAREDRRPSLGAGAVARGLPAAFAREEVDGEAAAVEQHGAVARPVRRDRGPRGRGRGGCRPRPGGGRPGGPRPRG